MIGIIGAMDQEIKAYLNAATNIVEKNWNGVTFYSGYLFNKHVCIVKSGVGKVLASAVCQKLIDTFNVNKIVFTGVAGAINPEYNIGDIVVSTDTMQHDMDATDLGFRIGEIPYSDFYVIKSDKELFNILQKCKIDNHKIWFGRILTGDVFVSSGNSRRTFMRETLNGDAVEMEGAAIGTVASLNHIPFIIVRTISDKADGEATNSFEEFLPVVADNSYKVVKQLLQSL